METKFKYVVSEILSKNGQENPCHKEMLSRPCNFAKYEAFDKYIFNIGIFGEDFCKQYVTSSVLNVTENNSGVVRIETVNTIYKLTPISGGENN